MGNVAIPGNGIWIRRGCPPTAPVLRFVIAPLRVKQAIRFVIARLRRSRGNLAVHAGTQESPGESATAYRRFPRRFAPRNDKLGGLMP